MNLSISIRLILLFCVFSSSISANCQGKKFYKTWIYSDGIDIALGKPDELRLVGKGYLTSINDQTIEIINDRHLGNPLVSSFPKPTIDLIEFRSESQTGIGAIAGAATGFLLGFLLSTDDSLTGNPSNPILNLKLVSGAIIAIPFSLIGMLFASGKVTFKINDPLLNISDLNKYILR